MSSIKGACIIFASLAMAACLRAEPATTGEDYGRECAGTQPGNTCLSLAFTIRPSIREDAPETAIGALHWAVFRGGDVGLFGPGDHAAIYDGIEESVDLSAADAVYLIHLPDVLVRPYQVLAFLDRDGDGKSGDGEAVTFPSEAFEVQADRETHVRVVFDYVR